MEMQWFIYLFFSLYQRENFQEMHMFTNKKECNFLTLVCVEN